MLETKQMKVTGTRFGRSFQTALRTSVMFSGDHPSVARPIEQSFQLLNELLKQVGQFTIGFVDNQVLINNVLTTDPGLALLQKEFSKRGIAALTFEAGLTLSRFRHIVTVLSAPASTIEAAGGIREYLELHEIPGARIVAAARNQKTNEEGDRLIESDSEAFILSKQLAEEGPRDFMESLDALLESACLDPSSRATILAGMNSADPNAAGTGYGVPVAVPNIVIDKSTKPGEGWEQSGAGGNGGTFSGATGGGSRGPGGGSGGSGSGGGFGGTGSGGSFGGTDDSFVGIAPGPGLSFGGPGSGSGEGGPGVPGGGPYVIGQPASYAGGASSGGGYRTFMELVDDSVNRSLLEDKGNPRKSYLALARILKESRLDTVLSHFPEGRREELRTMPAEQLAAEYIEDSTLKLIGKQLSQINDKTQDKFVVEESVLRLLARSLQATHAADRLAFKLAKYFQEFSTPPHLQQKVQDELRWTAMSQKQRFTQLMEKSRYDFTEFRRFIDFIKDLIQQREAEKVTELVLHYFDFLDDSKVAIEAEELSRSIEVIRTTKLGRESEAAIIIQRLSGVLMREDVSELVHFQAANNLSILSQSASVFEGFDKVLMVAEGLRQSVLRDPAKHQKCCATGLSRMLSPTSIERLIELYIMNRTDANYTRLAATILRHSHPAGTEAAIKHLIDEKNATNRLALLRLIAQIGPLCLEHARKYLQDERWFVVRNMCNLLAELRDPELAEHVGKVLKHPEVRVQQAALNALTKTRAQGRAEWIARALPDMVPVVQEQALDELLFLKAVASVTGLEAFLQSSNANLPMVRKALQIIGNTPGEEATAVLQRLVSSQETPEALHKAATELLRKKGEIPEV